MKIVTANNLELDFDFSESAKCWMSSGLVNNVKVDFEIYQEEYLQEKIDWDYFKEFVSKLENSNNLPELIIKSEKVLLSLAEAFGSSISQQEKIDDFKMEFVGLSFKGEVENLFIKSYAYSLWFNIVNKENPYSYVDPYGDYITDVEGQFIVGARRQQC